MFQDLDCRLIEYHHRPRTAMDVFALASDPIRCSFFSRLLTPIFSESGTHEFPLKSIPGVPILREVVALALLAMGAKAEAVDANARILHAVESFMVLDLFSC